MSRPLAAILLGSAIVIAACAGGSRPTTVAAPPDPAAPTTEVPATAAAPSPSTSTTSITTTTTTTLPPGPIVIHGTGDVNLDPATIPDLSANGFGYALSGLEGRFVDDDLTLINLECSPSTEGTRQDRPFNFRCDPDALPQIRADGVEVVTLGNNHAMDYGAEALVDGLKQVRSAGLEVVGAGADRSEAFAPAIVDASGWRVAVLGFGGVYLAQDWLATDERPGISDGLDIEAMTAAVVAIRDDVDLVIASIHWCCELETSPNQRNRDHAEALVAAGVDIVLGHHQHRLQPVERVGDSIVFWGLGNFVWPRNSAAGADTAVARVEVAADGGLTGCLLDATIVSAGHPTLDDPTRTSC